jgi:RES domain-containing protein
VRHLRRGGDYFRVADPDWSNPLSASYSRERGGRWNPPGSFGVVYLNRSVALARAQLRHKLVPRGIEPEDLQHTQAPVLVTTRVPDNGYVDAVTSAGLKAMGLPSTYPRDAAGDWVPHGVCQPIGERLHEDGEPGIACKPCVQAAPVDGEELAYFGRRRLRVNRTQQFADWY